jgi:hypothetical protein
MPRTPAAGLARGRGGLQFEHQTSFAPLETRNTPVDATSEGQQLGIRHVLAVIGVGRLLDVDESRIGVDVADEAGIDGEQFVPVKPERGGVHVLAALRRLDGIKRVVDEAAHAQHPIDAAEFAVVQPVAVLGLVEAQLGFTPRRSAQF